MAQPCVPVRIDRLCCPICSRLLRNPVTVLCGHNFCLHCIQARWDRDNSIRCPECDWMFARRPKLIMNTTLAELVRDAERRGSERRAQPDAGASPHAEKRARTSAEMGPPESSLCTRHSRRLDAYCCTDELLLCSLCAAEHQGHRIGSVRLQRRRTQEKLKDMQITSKQILQQQEKECESIRAMLNEVQEEARRAEDRCETVVSSAINSLQRRYLSAKELIVAQEQEATDRLHSRFHTLQEEMERARSRDAELESLAQTASDVGFLQAWPSHLAPLLCHSEAFEDPLLPLKTTQTVIEQIGKQVEDLCDKEWTSLFQTADGGEQQASEEDDTQQGREANSSQSNASSSGVHTGPNAEPTTRRQFLQYARELTLDPSTAHRDLVVSAGDREVKLSPQTENLRGAQSCERFLKRRQVLCREGLQGERCYYEIEVEGPKAEIALAYRGIDRKSSTASSAFGGNANSWSLDRSAVYSVCHSDEGIQLTRAPRHHRIGVYLKFNEGTLAFYEVSDVWEMIFLYKVETQFKEPLYPGFWLGEKSCIRICDLKQEE